MFVMSCIAKIAYNINNNEYDPSLISFLIICLNVLIKSILQFLLVFKINSM